MLILADENVSGETVRVLRIAGFKVDWIAESHPGVDDRKVLELANQHNCFLLTSDKALASTAARNQNYTLFGVLLLRLDSLTAHETSQLVLKTIQGRNDWRGLFGILAADGIRIRNIPI
jgi:predicted nuclease of predicted toxin-antitoxin system